MDGFPAKRILQISGVARRRPSRALVQPGKSSRPLHSDSNIADMTEIGFDSFLHGLGDPRYRRNCPLVAAHGGVATPRNS